MRRPFVAFAWMMVGMLVIFMIGCGNDDDDDETKSTTQNPKPAVDTGVEVRQITVDFDAEEQRLRELFDTHNEAVKADKINQIMVHWLRREKPEVFIVHEFGGAITRAEKWSQVKNFWDGTKKVFGSTPLPGAVAEVGIDARAKNATFDGNFSGFGSGKYRAAFRKDDDEWKLRAIGFGSNVHKEIKAIKTPPAK